MELNLHTSSFLVLVSFSWYKKEKSQFKCWSFSGSDYFLHCLSFSSNWKKLMRVRHLKKVRISIFCIKSFFLSLLSLSLFLLYFFYNISQSHLPSNDYYIWWWVSIFNMQSEVSNEWREKKHSNEAQKLRVWKTLVTKTKLDGHENLQQFLLFSLPLFFSLRGNSLNANSMNSMHLQEKEEEA